MVGANEMAMRLLGICPALKRLSVTVGMGVPVSGERVPIVRLVGPSLVETSVDVQRFGVRTRTYPRMPSTLWKPSDCEYGKKYR